MRPLLCADGLVISSGKIVLVNVFTAVGGVVNLRSSPCGRGTRVGFGHMAGEISWLFGFFWGADIIEEGQIQKGMTLPFFFFARAFPLCPSFLFICF